MNQRDVWNSIAESWNRFRRRPFRDFDKLVERIKIPKTSAILEIGCGNARHLLYFKEHDLYGLDFSFEMLKYARELSQKNGIKITLVQGDCRFLPFKSESFDLVIAMAVLHHLKNPLESIIEAYRVLKPGGFFVGSVWNKWQPRFLFYALTGMKETFVSWRVGGSTYQRYYRLISKNDLKVMLRLAGFRKVEVFYATKGRVFYQNIFFISKK